MKLPSDQHPITLQTLPQRLTVRFKGTVIAQSDETLVVQEANYPPVYYVPRAHINAKYFSRTPHTSHCPYKGDASYYSLVVDGETAENAAWSYEAPYPALAEISEHVAFYPDKVAFEV
ncbi:DUF427 domain-containing protein [Pseudomonas sp. HR96]|uniref:DUF427 domain-containing protein n=1 Tax=Pseudomonas sp. HR96 TaxID=1027966 RepID=UPI002A7596A2|nr:DUF427 domain-containing protein [Pseudomonas sp. HR96]WPO97643.1 DUF427 domain-containing protein [Pseudomonas sp. HR96]